MEFRLDKCAETIFKKVKSVHLQTLILYVNKVIHKHEQGKTYQYHKYLGIEEMKVYNVQSRDSHYFRISKHKMYRRRVCKYH